MRQSSKSVVLHVVYFEFVGIRVSTVNHWAPVLVVTVIQSTAPPAFVQKMLEVFVAANGVILAFKHVLRRDHKPSIK